MATSLQNLVYDNSSLANFTNWAQAISTFMGTAGWTKSADTGQVNWGTISTVPAANTAVYEIWEPNDGLTNFYLKIWYGSAVGNAPSLRMAIGTVTDGAGNFVGNTVGEGTPNPSFGSGSGVNSVWDIAEAFGQPQGSTQFECRFSGEPGRISFLLWRTNAVGTTCAFAVERSLNASGAYTGTHVTIYATVGGGNSGSGGHNQQTLHFAVGPAPAVSLYWGGNSAGGLPIRVFFPNSNYNAAFNGAIPFDTCAPFVGFFDLPGTVIGGASPANMTEGQVFTVNMYGSPRTYVATFGYSIQYSGPSRTRVAVCVRYD